MQDKAILEIGKLKGAKVDHPYQNFIQDMFPGKDYDMVLAVFQLKKVKDKYQCTLEGVDIDKVGKKNFRRYAYRKGSARGGDITMTTKFGDITKKFKNFYPNQISLSKKIALAQNFEEEYQILLAIEELLATESELLKTNLLETYQSLDKNQQMTTGFSIRLEGLKDFRYPEDFKSIQHIIYQNGTEGKSNKYSVKSEGKNQCCSICHKVKPVIHGFGSPFKYSTVDKIGFVSGFFNQKNNWKNYPICSDCALDFENGKNYVSEHLSKIFYGKTYFLIPQLMLGKDEKLLNKAIDLLGDLDYQPKDQVMTRENFLMKKIANSENGQNKYFLNLLFYEENQTTKAIKIKLMLEELLPSRFQQLFEIAPSKVEKAAIFKEAVTSKKQKLDLKFNFAILRTFFGDQFYEIIQTVFLGKPLSEKVLFDTLMQKLRKTYIDRGFSDIGKYQNSYYTLFLSKELKWNTSLLKLAMMTIAYLKELNIISSNKKAFDMEVEKKSVKTSDEKKQAFDDEKLRAFIQEHHDFFDLENGHKVGVFAVGVLVRQVFNLQSYHLDGNTPFEKKLKGYDLNPELLKNIYKEALEKISRYTNAHSYLGLRSFINEYFTLNSHKMGQSSNNELSFYFVAGLEFGNQFKTKNK